MANIKISRKLFEKEIGKLDEKMQERIAMFGTPLESFNDEEIELEIFPNRPDMLSYQGFKRSFLAFLGKKTGIKKYKISKPQKDYKVIIDSSVKNVRPYTVCAIVKGLKFDDDKIKEIIDIQEKLHLTLGRKRKKFGIGIYPLDKIKLPITYKALEPDKIKFVPLESDKEMSGLQILQRHPAGRDYAHLLAGKEKFPIFVDADGKVMSMPPIINSQLTGKITEETKDVFIECSGFDFGLLKKCLNIIVTTLADMGSDVYQMELKYKRKEFTPDLASEKMKLSFENANKLLGLSLNKKQIEKFLGRMGHNCSKNFVEIPAWRTDVMHEVDLIEDIAIAYGYENFEPEIPDISTLGQEFPNEIFKRKFSEILVGLGMLEVSSYHLTTKRDMFEKMDMHQKNKDCVVVEESKTEYSLLKKNLAHCLLKILSENKDSEYPQKIFEIGRVFEEKSSEINEKENLSIAITLGNFTDMKQIIECFFRSVGTEVKVEESLNSPNYFVDGRVAEIKLGEKSLGFFGEVHPKILRNWKIKMPVVLVEINLDEVFEKLV
ncbi:MAG: phenylalanine--tRNA ligase subunit beta [Nanoarchaeota archaeon]|nr:phenylalanine--tRNA ligase subunit beta [Nanoarchaeota archaeon]